MEKTQYNRKYYLENKERLNKKSKDYHEKSKEAISVNKKEYYEVNKELISRKRKEYYENNKEKIKKRKKLYRKNNKIKIAKQKADSQRKFLSTTLGKLKHNIRAAIRRSLVKNGYSKKYSSEDILGCTTEEFKKHIESKFESWMTWENKGLYNGELNYGWDLDHIIPLSKGKTEKDIIELNHYTNIQPLCSHINRDIKKNN